MTEARIRYSCDPEQAFLPADCQNVIVLSEEFYREILSHPIPADLDAATALSGSPGVLDLFMWLSYRSFTARGTERIPLFGDFGLASQLGSTDYARPRQFREKLERWLKVIRTMWPECRAEIDKDGLALLLARPKRSSRERNMPVETFADRRIWTISLEQIEATVSEFLGPGRVRGNHQSPTFSRHVSMYLTRQVGGWSYPKINRFYNARHHTTAIAATRRIERLREQDESVGALLLCLPHYLRPKQICGKRKPRNPSGKL